MTRMGRREFFRRLAVLVLLVSGSGVAGHERSVMAAGLIVIPVFAYVALPPIAAPEGALRYDAGRTQIEPDRSVISSAFRERSIAFDTIRSVRRYRHGLPNWLYLFVPFMLAKGQYGGAGAMLLAREGTGMELVLKGSRKVRLADSGYDDEIVQILRPISERAASFAVPCGRYLTQTEEV